MSDEPNLIAAIRATHTNLGEPCEHCGERFAYDECRACGDFWPCSSIALVTELELGRAADRRRITELETAAQVAISHASWLVGALERDRAHEAIHANKIIDALRSVLAAEHTQPDPE